MNRLEDELRAALAREPAPPGFDQRLLRRLQPAPRRRWWGQWAAAALAASLLLGAGTAEYKRRQASAAKSQLMRALVIAGMMLNDVEQRVNDR